MPDLTKFDVYKIINSIRESYIFSVQDTENSDEVQFHYYLLTRFQDNVPVLKRLNNTIEMINSGKLRLQRLNSDSKELDEFTKLIIECRKTPHPSTTSEIDEPYFSDIGENDLRLIKNK